jgi:uncharacterized membrane protein YhiD involved in acid resistance
MAAYTHERTREWDRTAVSTRGFKRVQERVQRESQRVEERELKRELKRIQEKSTRVQEKSTRVQEVRESMRTSARERAIKRPSHQTIITNSTHHSTLCKQGNQCGRARRERERERERVAVFFGQ